jgi:glutathione S-transferase
MSEDLVFFHNPQSRALIVHWMLEEIGQPYELKLVRFDRGDNRKPEFLAINPMGKLPTLIHRGIVVTESAAVCAYLADAFPSVGLAPAQNDPARATYLRWMFFGAGCLEPALVDQMLKRPSAEKRALGYGSYEDTLNTLEKALQPGPFILGDRFSAADVYLGSEMQWGLMTKALEPRPAFSAYLERATARPAHKRVLEQNEKLAAQLK